MIRFDEVNHEYYIGDKRLMSVSEICDLVIGDSYSNIPEWILERAAEFGTDVHEMIEVYNLHGIVLPDIDERKNHCLKEYIRLSNGITPIESEYMGHYKDYFAGTMDLVGRIDDELYIIDFKTTSKFHEERTALQCSLYRLIYGWDKIKGLKCIWLPKDRKGHIYDLKSWDKEELLRTVRGSYIAQSYKV